MWGQEAPAPSVSGEAAVPVVVPQVANASAEVEEAIRRVYPSLVRIYVVMEEGSDGRMRKLQGSGSGTIISAEGHVLTNHHVAGRGTRFVCTLSSREEIDATLVGTDALSDLAIIKLDLATRRRAGEPLPVAHFGDSDQLKVGDVVLAMGSPGGLSQSVTRGIVANTELILSARQGGLVLDGEKVGELVRWIGHDAVIYPGNSGGPLVNLRGEIIGVNEVGVASLGGAIPSNLAQRVTRELLAHGRVTRSWIGLEVQPLLRYSGEDERGVLVASVWKDSPAARAGIEPGDTITEFNGVAVADSRAEEDIPLFNAMTLGIAPGTEAIVKGRRGGETREWKLTTVEREPNLAKEVELSGWAITARDLTTVSALENNRENTRGVMVDTVRSGGPSAEAKPPLRPNDIIVQAGGREITSIADLADFTEAHIGNATAPKAALVRFERNREDFVTVVKIGPEPERRRPQLADKPWLGASLQVLTDDLAAALGVTGKKGVRVTAVTPGGPAALAGLLPGDLLLKLDGRVINARRPEDSEVLPELIRSYPVDAVVEFEGRRGEEPLTLSVTLSLRPKDELELAEYKDDRFELTARELSASQRARYELDDAIQGVSILKIEPSGWAALGGLAPDDIVLKVNGRAMESIPVFRETLLALRENRPRSVTFFIRRGPRTLFREVEPKW